MSQADSSNTPKAQENYSLAKDSLTQDVNIEIQKVNNIISDGLNTIPTIDTTQITEAKKTDI